MRRKVVDLLGVSLVTFGVFGLFWVSLVWFIAGLKMQGGAWFKWPEYAAWGVPYWVVFGAIAVVGLVVAIVRRVGKRESKAKP